MAAPYQRKFSKHVIACSEKRTKGFIAVIRIACGLQIVFPFTVTKIVPFTVITCVKNLAVTDVKQRVSLGPLARNFQNYVHDI